MKAVSGPPKRQVLEDMYQVYLLGQHIASLLCLELKPEVKDFILYSKESVRTKSNVAQVTL